MYLCIHLFVLVSLGITSCLEVTPIWANITYMNEKYVAGFRTYIRRFSRKSPYYYNLSGTIKHTWGNNISVHIVLTEFLHNEYRPSFIDMRFKLCDFLNKEQYIGGMVKKMVPHCPAPKGFYELANMTLDTSQFPNVFPFEKGGADIDIELTDTRERLFTIVYHATFSQKKKH